MKDNRFTSKQKITLAITGTMFIMVLALLVVILLIGSKNRTVTDDAADSAQTLDTALSDSDRTLTVSADGQTPASSPKSSLNEGLTYDEKWQEGNIRYNGNVYRYNSSIRTFLFMGIDNDGKAVAAPDMVSGGQSDAMFLMVVDDESGCISVIAINRNTMTDIKVCDSEGRNVGTFKGQICLQHGYGDGLRLSCQKSVDAVSYLFYNIPIAGYFAMNMGGLPLLNDAVGGVTVTLPEDYVIHETGSLIKAGEPFLLKGRDAYSFIRYRDTTEFDSASIRMARHEIYLSALLTQMQKVTGGSKNMALKIYDEIEDYTVSSIIFADIAEDISKYGFSDDRMFSLTGETKQGSTFEEFFVNENELYDLILNVFYDIII